MDGATQYVSVVFLEQLFLSRWHPMRPLEEVMADLTEARAMIETMIPR